MEEGIETMTGFEKFQVLICGGSKEKKILQKMTWFLATNFYQSNIVKFTEYNNTSCSEHEFLNVGFNLQAKVSNLSNALGKI